MPRKKKPLNTKLYRGPASQPTMRPKTVDKPESLELARNPEDLADLPDYRDASYQRGSVHGMKAAILAALLLGENPGRISKQYNIPYDTVYAWQAEFDITSPILRRDQLSQSLLTFIEQEIKNLIAVGIITSEEDWVKWQSAEGLADFIQVKGALILQLLTAFGRANQQAAELRQQQIEAMKNDA